MSEIQNKDKEKIIKKENSWVDVKTIWELNNLVNKDMERLKRINRINDDYIKQSSRKVKLSNKEMETLDKISSTMLKRVALISKLQQDIIDKQEEIKAAEEEREEMKRKRLERNKLEIKLNI